MTDRPIDPYAAALEARMAAATPRRSRADLARLLGLDSSQVTRIFQGKRRIQIHEQRSIDEWLNDEHGGLAEAGARFLGPELGGRRGIVVPGPGMVPLYGRVGASSGAHLTIAEQSILSWVPMHPAQINLREPFALVVDDESMYPRYKVGEIAYVAPFKMPARGQDAVVVTKDQHGFLKEFVERTQKELVMHQLNPDERLTFPLADVIQLHSIVGRG